MENPIMVRLGEATVKSDGKIVVFNTFVTVVDGISSWVFQRITIDSDGTRTATRTFTSVEALTDAVRQTEKVWPVAGKLL